MMELSFDGGQVRVDVGVIEFQIVHHQRARMVVHELGALVEEGRVVFVGFDDEERRIAEPRTHVEIAGNAADQESRRQAGVFQYPGQHRCGRGFSVRSRDRQHPAVGQHFAREPLRPRHVRDAAFEQRFDDRHAARADIAHDDDIGTRLELLGAIALRQFDAERRELRAHRRVYVAIRTADAMSRAARNRGDAAHESSADAEDVYVHNHADCTRALVRDWPRRMQEWVISAAPIIDSAALDTAVAAISDHEAIGLDTEFMRERTYYAQLCLLQLGSDALSVCVDPLALASLDALRPLMAAARPCKILHAARQDMEVLAPAVGTVRNVFDTQVAAALVGFPAQVGYADLVRQVLGIELHKSQTRTDWSRRPLSAAQIEYALDDVRHLPPLREQLVRAPCTTRATRLVRRGNGADRQRIVQRRSRAGLATHQDFCRPRYGSPAPGARAGRMARTPRDELRSSAQAGSCRMPRCAT